MFNKPDLEVVLTVTRLQAFILTTHFHFLSTQTAKMPRNLKIGRVNAPLAPSIEM
jgi:hypothetical protein